MELKCTPNKIGMPLLEDFQDEQFIAKIKAYGQFLSSFYGPRGHCYLVTNPTGSSALANSSLNIVDTVGFSHPAIKLVNTFIAAQNEAFGSGGLYLGIACCGLLRRALAHPDVPTYQVQLIAEKVIALLNDHLKASRLRTKLDIGNLNDVCNYVRTMMFSKAELVCLHDTDDVIIAIVKAFIETTPTEGMDKFGNIYIQPFDHYCPAKVVRGLCLNSPELARREYKSKIVDEAVNILIFNIPIAADVPEAKDLQDSSLSSLLHNEYSNLLINVLNKWKIRVVFSQKYIHEEVRFDLERAGFLVFERLGLDFACALVNVVKCLPICSLTNMQFSMNERFIGSALLSIEEINEKCYLCITNPVLNSDVTLTISETVTTGGNIKKKVENCLKLLRLTAANPHVIPGAGCFEASCILAFLKMRCLNDGSIANQLDVPQAAVAMVTKMFMDVFCDLAIEPTRNDTETRINYALDFHSGHLWKSEGECFTKDTIHHSSCACGELTMDGRCFLPFIHLDSEIASIDDADCQCSGILDSLTKSSKYLDYYPAKCNALSLAFSAFIELYRVKLCIYDSDKL